MQAFMFVSHFSLAVGDAKVVAAQKVNKKSISFYLSLCEFSEAAESCCTSTLWAASVSRKGKSAAG
jgi:hypothetical protein